MVVIGQFGEKSGPHRPRYLRSCHVYFRSERKQRSGDFIDGFVARSPVDQPDRSAGSMIGKKAGEHARAAGVVRRIEQNLGIALDGFEPPKSFWERLWPWKR